MNNKGITLVTVVVIIIVMTIIATTSIIAGNKIVVNTKEYSDEQIVENVREAVKRKKAEVLMQGSITPIGAGYPGKANPAVGDGSVIAEGWYQLDEPELRALGVMETNERMLINYEYEVVLPMRDPNYFEKYQLITLVHKIQSQFESGEVQAYFGEELYDVNYGMGNMYVDKATNTSYGTGWFYVTSDDIPAGYEQYTDSISWPYLFNYNTGEFVAASGLEHLVVQDR